MGIMFAIVMVLLHNEGENLPEEVLGSNVRLNNMRQVFQMILAYWVWLKKDMYWVHGNVVARKRACTAIMTRLQDLLRPWSHKAG